jgi:hypothetical protein
VKVSDAGVVVDFVRSYMPKDEVGGQKNGEVAYSYTVKPRAVSVNDDVVAASGLVVAPNPARDVINVLAPSTATIEVVITNVLGQSVIRSSLTVIDVSQLPHGLYDVMTRINGQEARNTIMIGGR